MFLGTSKRWWAFAGVLFVLGFALVAGGTGGTLGDVIGIIILFSGIMVFAAAPMRYGRDDRPKQQSTPSPTIAAPVIPSGPPPPRANIEARDANEV